MPQEYYETSMMVVRHNLKVHQNFVVKKGPVSLKPTRFLLVSMVNMHEQNLHLMQNSRMHVFLLKWLDFASENGRWGVVTTYLIKTETMIFFFIIDGFKGDFFYFIFFT